MQDRNSSFTINTNDSSIHFCGQQLEPKIGGYDPKIFLRSPSDGLICALCLHVVCNPHQCYNGHCFCYGCIHQALILKNVCPICKTGLTLNSLSKNLFMQNVIEDLEVCCVSVNHSFSQSDCCEWTGPLHLRGQHMMSCGFAARICQLNNYHSVEQHTSTTEGRFSLLLRSRRIDLRSATLLNEWIIKWNDSCRAEILAQIEAFHTGFHVASKIALDKVQKIPCGGVLRTELVSFDHVTLCIQIERCRSGIMEISAVLINNPSCKINAYALLLCCEASPFVIPVTKFNRGSVLWPQWDDDVQLQQFASLQENGHDHLNVVVSCSVI